MRWKRGIRKRENRSFCSEAVISESDTWMSGLIPMALDAKVWLDMHVTIMDLEQKRLSIDRVKGCYFPLTLLRSLRACL